MRNTEIYVVQDVANRYPLEFQKNDEPQVLSVNDHLFCLLVTVDAALQAGALQVTVILPTFPYSRQHKKKGRESLSAARVGQMLEAFGVSGSSPWTSIPRRSRTASITSAWRTSTAPTRS